MTANRIYQLLGTIPDRAFGAGVAGDDIEAKKYAILYKDVSIGWKYAQYCATHNLPLPTIREPGDEILVRAYMYCANPQVYANRTIQRAVALTRPNMHQIAMTLRTLLLPADSSVSVVARVTGLEVDVVAAYEKLFFNILDRRNDSMFINQIIYPHGRMVEYFEGYLRTTGLESLLYRAGFNHGLRDVLHFTGLTNDLVGGMASAESAKQLEGMMMAQGFILARNGWLNQSRDVRTIDHARQLLSAAKLGGAEETSIGSDIGMISDVLWEEMLKYGDGNMRRNLAHKRSAQLAVEAEQVSMHV